MQMSWRAVRVEQETLLQEPVGAHAGTVFSCCWKLLDPLADEVMRTRSWLLVHTRCPEHSVVHAHTPPPWCRSTGWSCCPMVSWLTPLRTGPCSHVAIRTESSVQGCIRSSSKQSCCMHAGCLQRMTTGCYCCKCHASIGTLPACHGGGWLIREDPGLLECIE